jgi:hypothetical protein
MLSLLTHVSSLWITVQTPGLFPTDNMIKKLVSLSFTLQHMFQADTPYELSSVSPSNSLAPSVQNLPIPQNLRDDVMHTLHAVAEVFTDRPQCYVAKTL